MHQISGYHWPPPRAFVPGPNWSLAGPSVSQANVDMLRSLEQDLHAKMQVTMNEISKDMEDEVKDAAMETAAMQTGVSLALAAIPVVGWAASAIVSVAGAIGSGKYQREAEEIMSDAQSVVARLQAESQARISAMMTKVFNHERPHAIQLALSGVPLSGFGSAFKSAVSKIGSELERFGRRIEKNTEFIRDPIKDFGRSIEKEADRFEDRVQKEVIDPLVGRTVKLEAREARERIINRAESKLKQHEDEVRELVRSPRYRANLRLELAKKLRSNPAIQKMVSDRLAIELEIASLQEGSDPLSTPGLPARDGSTKAMSKLPLVVAAGAAAWALLG